VDGQPFDSGEACGGQVPVERSARQTECMYGCESQKESALKIRGQTAEQSRYVTVAATQQVTSLTSALTSSEGPSAALQFCEAAGERYLERFFALLWALLSGAEGNASPLPLPFDLLSAGGVSGSTGACAAGAAEPAGEEAVVFSAICCDN
jgi:hypothetical protein